MLKVLESGPFFFVIWRFSRKALSLDEINKSATNLLSPSTGPLPPRKLMVTPGSFTFLVYECVTNN